MYFDQVQVEVTHEMFAAQYIKSESNITWPSTCIKSGRSLHFSKRQTQTQIPHTHHSSKQPSLLA